MADRGGGRICILFADLLVRGFLLRDHLLGDGGGQSDAESDTASASEGRGRCVLFGVMPSDQRVSIHTLPLHFGRTLTGSEGGQSQPEIDIPAILRVLAERKTDWRGFISHRGSFLSLESDIIKMRSGEVVHLISTP
jgi:S-(hydroxymethyl)glutathione dehydrogenase / alcohol dehydrogenase